MAPLPLRGFRRGSAAILDGAVWELTTYLPGEIVAGSAAPSLDELGALLATYHDAAEPIALENRRPSSTALRDLPAIVAAFPDGETKDESPIQLLGAPTPTASGPADLLVSVLRVQRHGKRVIRSTPSEHERPPL